MRNTIRKHIWNVNMKNGMEYKGTWSANDNDEIFWWMAFANEWKRSSSGCVESTTTTPSASSSLSSSSSLLLSSPSSPLPPFFPQHINSRIHIQLKKFARHRWKFYLQENHPANTRFISKLSTQFFDAIAFVLTLFECVCVCVLRVLAPQNIGKSSQRITLKCCFIYFDLFSSLSGIYLFLCLIAFAHNTHSRAHIPTFQPN